MATFPTLSPPFDVTVRVGCSLAYEVTGSAMLLLNLRPSPDRNHEIVFEAFTGRRQPPGRNLYRTATATGSRA